MTTVKIEAAGQGLEKPMRTLAISAVLLAFNLSTLMVSIANVALPTIADDLNIAPADAIWIITIYQLAVIAFLLPISTLADVIGYRPIYLYGLIIFIIGCGVCSFSSTFGLALTGRFLQGLGAAAIQGVYIYSMAHIYPRHLVGKGIGLGTLTSQITSMLAPTIAGLILLFTVWQGLFFLAVPLGIVAFVVSRKVLPDEKNDPGKFEVLPVILNVLTFGMVVLGIDQLSRSNASILWYGFIVLGLACGAFQVWYQRKAKMPLIPVDLFVKPEFTLTMFTTFFAFLSSGTALVALPFYLQNELHLAPQYSGLLLSAWPVATAVSGLVAGWWFDNLSPGKVGCIGLLIMASGLFIITSLPPNPALTLVVVSLLLSGLGFGIFVTPNVKAIIMMVPPERSGAASGMQATSRLLGQMCGAIVVGVALARAGASWSQFALGAAAIASLIGAYTSVKRHL